MSRVCLIGVGDPSFLPSRHHAGPGLRCGHFAAALAGAGHELLVLYVSGGSARLRTAAAAEPVEMPGGGRIRALETGEDDFASAGLAQLVGNFGPDALVGVSAHGAAMAARLGIDVPLWADIFGDLMAEAQAKAAAHDNDISIAHFWSVLAPVLASGDRFSAVSRAQAYALLGQLGLAGRLNSATAGEELVSVIPCAAEPRVSRAGADSGLRGRTVAEDAFIVMWNGGFNTWCDVETLFDGLQRAMLIEPTLVFVATGGAIRGHDESTHRRFLERVEASPMRDRFHLLGWVSDEQLPAIVGDADVGIVIERDLYERRLGAENRIVSWMADGVPAVTTALSEFGQELASRGLVFAVTHGSADAIASMLSELARDRQRLRRVGEQCRRYAAEHLGYSACARPLLAWCAAPRRCGDYRRPRPLVMGLVSQPRAMVHLLEAYLAELSLGQVLYRAARWLTRRLLRRHPAPLEPQSPDD